MKNTFRPLFILLACFCTLLVDAQDDANELAKKLANPVASVVSLPFQNNFDYGLGEDEEGFRWTMNVQPVIPIKVGTKINLINRLILPIMKQNNVIGDEKQGGLGDATYTCFIAPQKASKIIWGIGPAFLIPTGSDAMLGTGKFGIGPSGLVLAQIKGITAGVLVNHLNSVAGKGERADVNQTFFQPFFTYSKKGYSPGIVGDLTQNWESDTFTGSLTFQVSKVTKLGASQPISIGGGIKYFVASPDGGPKWGVRFMLSFVFPKKG